jgi:hypothetical protein
MVDRLGMLRIGLFSSVLLMMGFAGVLFLIPISASGRKTTNGKCSGEPVLERLSDSPTPFFRQ